MIVHWRRRKVFLEKIKLKKIFEDVYPGKYNQFFDYPEGTERVATYSVNIKGNLTGVYIDILVINGKPKINVALLKSLKEK